MTPEGRGQHSQLTTSSGAAVTIWAIGRRRVRSTSLFYSAREKESVAEKTALPERDSMGDPRTFPTFGSSYSAILFLADPRPRKLPRNPKYRHKFAKPIALESRAVRRPAAFRAPRQTFKNFGFPLPTGMGNQVASTSPFRCETT